MQEKSRVGGKNEDKEERAGRGMVDRDKEREGRLWERRARREDRILGVIFLGEWQGGKRALLLRL